MQGGSVNLVGILVVLGVLTGIILVQRQREAADTVVGGRHRRPLLQLIPAAGILVSYFALPFIVASAGGQRMGISIAEFAKEASGGIRLYEIPAAWAYELVVLLPLLAVGIGALGVWMEASRQREMRAAVGIMILAAVGLTLLGALFLNAQVEMSEAAGGGLSLGFGLAPWALLVSLVASIYLAQAGNSAAGGTSNALRKCPYCAEPIQAEAVRCRHCGSEVTPVVPSQPPVAEVDDPDALDRATEEAMRQ